MSADTVKVVLGPVSCQGCRCLVTWNGWEWQDTSAGRLWRFAGRRHECRAERKAA